MRDSAITDFSDLVGHVIQGLSGAHEGSDLVQITTDRGLFRLYHDQSCCERVALAELHGDPNDLIGSTIQMAAESTNSDDPPPGFAESWTWTFYRLVTDKASLVMRWLGESNGYYSESVTFERIRKPGREPGTNREGDEAHE